MTEAQLERGNTYIRGATATFQFKLPCSFTDLTSATIYFWQKRYSGTTESPLPITKSLANCSAGTNADELILTLSPVETSRFTDKERVYVQFQGVTATGTIASKQEMITMYPYYNPNDVPEPEPDQEGYIVLDGEST